MHTKTILERAFELADSGEFESITDLQKRLKSEGYTLDQLSGRTLTRQLKARMVAAKPPALQVAARHVTEE